MATKNLARTAIEVGRYNHNKWNRNYSHRQERARTREFLANVRKDLEYAEAYVPRARPKVGRAQADKLGPVWSFIEAQAGRPWNDVFSEIKRRFDCRTIAGRHILYDHILPQMVQHRHPHERQWRWWQQRGVFVDDEGILRLRSKKRRRRTYTTSRRLRPIQHEKIRDWMSGRRILERGSKLFWSDPLWIQWEDCQYFGWCWHHEHRDKQRAAGSYRAGMATRSRVREG